jgi:hypothetical protein
MLVHCTHCSRQIPAADLDVSTAIAKCRHCNAVFSFAAALEQEGGAPARPHRTPGAAAVSQPKGIKVEDWAGNLLISRRWFSLAFIFLAFFCAAWDGFLVFWYGLAFTEADTPWIMVVFPIGHLAVGVFLTYFTLCGLLNRTVIKVESGRLTIRHGPLPWPGNRDVDTADLDQLYCRRVIRNTSNGSSETYQLHVLTKSGQQMKLVSGLDGPEQALFLEQRIEQYLGIENRPVAGEYRG